jgi:hypothetical protein
MNVNKMTDDIAKAANVDILYGSIGEMMYKVR